MKPHRKLSGRRNDNLTDPFPPLDALVEHLRLVHFTLVITCIAILVTLSSNRDTELTLASQQLDKIRLMDDAARRSANRSGGELIDWLLVEAKRGLPGTPLPTQPTGPIYSASIYTEEYNIIGHVDLEIDGKTYPVMCEFDAPYWQISADDGKDLVAKLRSSSIKLPEKSSHGTQFAEFRTFWNLLGEIDSVDVAEPSFSVEMYRRVYSDEPSSSSTPAAIAQPQVARPSLLGVPVRFVRNLPLTRTNGDEVCLFENENLVFFDARGVRDAPPLGPMEIRASADYPTVLKALPPLAGTQFRDYVFAAKITYQKRPLNSQLRLAQLVGLLLPPGKFDNVFPELATFAGDFTGISLTDAAVVLHQERAHIPESVELLGMKLPVQSVAAWGTLAIIAVQLYLCLHLYELLQRVTRKQAYTDVPWIAVYTNQIAQTVFILTAGLLPPATLVFIAYESAENTLFRTAIITAVVFSFAGAVITCIFWHRAMSRLSAVTLN